jgi:hypothetical protein
MSIKCSSKEKAKERPYEDILKMNESGHIKMILSYISEIYRGTWRSKKNSTEDGRGGRSYFLEQKKNFLY